MTENESTPHPQDPAEGADFNETETDAAGTRGGGADTEADTGTGTDTEAGDGAEDASNRSGAGTSAHKPLDVEAREWDIDITQSDGPVLEEGDDLDTGAGIHRHRP